MEGLRQMAHVIKEMIDIEEQDLQYFLNDCFPRKYKARDLVNIPYRIPHEVYFVNKGIIRIFVIDRNGEENTIHFALENQFICDYSSFLQQKVSIEHLQVLEPTEIVVMPRESIQWVYDNLKEGEKMGRLIAEYYFIYFDNRIKNIYTMTPTERYESITKVFPDIHNRAPQHMIASYLGITSVHLSRLKKEARKKD